MFFVGKIVFVIGGVCGIGLGIVQCLVVDGVQIVFVDLNVD